MTTPTSSTSMRVECDYTAMFDKLWKHIDNSEHVKEILSVFNEDHTNADRVALALKHLQVFNLLPFEASAPREQEKTPERAAAARSLGNKCFAKKIPDLRGALSHYTTSITVSPGAAELALAFANRSAVFLELNKYRACLSDIEQALSHDYPEKLRYKLYDRRGKCYQMMDNTKSAILNFEQAMSSIPLGTMAPSRAEEMVRCTLARIESLRSARLAVHPDATNSAARPTLDNTYASSSFRVKYSPQMGRFVEANTDIAAGEVLIVARPYAAVVTPENYQTHCHHCLLRHDAMIPCKCCSLAMYCSEDCREHSWKQFHQLECVVLPSLLRLDLGHDWILTLRLILLASHRSNGLQGLYRTVRLLVKNKSSSQVPSTSDKFPSHDPEYRTMHYLIQNTEKRTFRDVYQLATMAACVVNCLEAYGVLVTRGGGDEEPDWKLFVGGLLLRYLQSLRCNSHAVADLLLETSGDRQLETSVERPLSMHCFGCAVYGVSSYLNHSCDANVVRSFSHGSFMTVVASRPIRAGEQIFCDYGYSFVQLTTDERRPRLLAEYFFLCVCAACVHRWPTGSELESVDPVYLCGKCGAALPRGDLISCAACGEGHVRDELRGRLQEVADGYCQVKAQLLDGSRADFTPQLAEMLNVMDRLVQRPCRVVHPMEDALRHNLMQMGNFYLV